MHPRSILGGLWLAAAMLVAGGLAAPAEDKDAGKKYQTVTLRGKVVWLADALKRRFGVDTDPDVSQGQVVLETKEGELYPLVKEFRGRGFWKDERLRDIEVELIARRFQGTNHLQVVQVYTCKKDQKYEIDYWCDICAIPMYELKECECCQGPIRIRERLLPPGQTQALPEK